DNAALYGRYLIETHLRIPASLAAPSVVTLYGVRVKLRGMVVIGLSQSGRSPDIVRVIESARDAGATTVAITNDPRAPLARAADEVLVLHAGAERSVAATKTYTAQLMLLSLLVAHTAGNSRLIRAHEALPGAVARALQTAPATVPVRLPDVAEEALSPHVYIVPLQLLAHHTARLRGLDPDHPQGLRKVTRVL